MDLQALVDYVEVNRTGFRKALKKHDKVLGPLGHPKLMATYLPKVEANFPEKQRLHVQVLSWCAWGAKSHDTIQNMHVPYSSQSFSLASQALGRRFPGRKSHGCMLGQQWGCCGNAGCH